MASCCRQQLRWNYPRVQNSKPLAWTYLFQGQQLQLHKTGRRNAFFKVNLSQGCSSPFAAGCLAGSFEAQLDKLFGLILGILQQSHTFLEVKVDSFQLVLLSFFKDFLGALQHLGQLLQHLFLVSFAGFAEVRTLSNLFQGFFKVAVGAIQHVPQLPCLFQGFREVCTGGGFLLLVLKGQLVGPTTTSLGLAFAFSRLFLCLCLCLFQGNPA